MSRTGVTIDTVAGSGKNATSLSRGDFIGLSGNLNENLNGEFKDMIVNKSGQSAANIANVNQTLTA